MPEKNYTAELLAHLDVMGVACEPGIDAVVITDPKALFDLLTEESFIAKTPAGNNPPVPAHRTDNPVGALQEWCQQRGPNARMPTYKISENVGTVNAPLFECGLVLDGERTEAKAPNKNQAKRSAAQQMLMLLAAKYGKVE